MFHSILVCVELSHKVYVVHAMLFQRRCIDLDLARTGPEAPRDRGVCRHLVTVQYN